jgi:tetratricopeptide (TPR) repeat protein
VGDTALLSFGWVNFRRFTKPWRGQRDYSSLAPARHVPLTSHPMRSSKLIFCMLMVVAFGVSCNREEKSGDRMKVGLDALYAANDPQAAIPHFQAVLQGNADHYGANYQLAVALDRAGRATEAKPYWERVMVLAEKAGDDATAETAKARLGSPPPPDRQALWMTAGLNLLYELNRPEDAAVEFRKILDENPDHYGATYQLATALDRSGRRHEADPLWEKVLGLAVGYEDAETEKTARERLAQK